MGIFSRKKKSEDKKKDVELKKSEVKEKVSDTKKRPIKPGKPELKKFDDVYSILKRPLVTEKSSNLGAYNQYAFEVSPSANKIQIKKAIETYYHVKPLKVNIVKVRGKSVRWGRTQGQTRGWKKAIVSLRQGDKIEVYEGV